MRERDFESREREQHGEEDRDKGWLNCVMLCLLCVFCVLVSFFITPPRKTEEGQGNEKKTKGRRK